MSRIPFAVFIGLAGFIAYVGVAVALADQVVALHWAIQTAYFVFAGMLWVLPAHYLVLWAGRKR